MARAGAALLAALAAAPVAAQGWRIERRDGVETVRLARPDGMELMFQCRRGGSRPGTGGFRLAVPSGIVSREAPAKELIDLRFSAGPEVVDLTVTARAEEVAPPRRRGAPAPAAIAVTALTFRQPGDAEAAAKLARLAALFADRRGRPILVEAKEIGLSAKLPAGAARELAGLKQGCLDGLPDIDDDVQGPWHQGVSSSDGETTVTLTASADRGPDGTGPEAKLVLACEHGEFSLRLSTPGRPIGRGFSAELSTGADARRIAFNAGPAREEATAEGVAAADMRALLAGADEATLAADLAGVSAPLRFDIHGLDFAARKMRTLCPGV